jgi:hypothetical protein
MTFPTDPIQPTETHGDHVNRTNEHFADASQHERPVLNGQDFGMNPNNTGDQASALNAALAAAAASQSMVFIPKGTYRFTSSITPQAYVTICGEGYGTILSYEGTGTFCFMRNLLGIQMRDLLIQGTQSTFTLWHMDECFLHSYQNVIFKGTSDAHTTVRPNQIGLRMSNNCGDNFFAFCRWLELGTGCLFDWTVGNKFNQCQWSGNYKSITNTAGLTASVVFQSCTFVTPWDGTSQSPHHINILGASGAWQIDNCWFEGAINSIIVGVSGEGGPSAFSLQNSHVASNHFNLALNHCRQPYLQNIQFANNPRQSPDHIAITEATCPEGTAINLITLSDPTEVPLTEFPVDWFVMSRTHTQVPYAGIKMGGGPSIIQGFGSPETVESAPVGSIFLNRNGGANTTLWVKESGVGNTGWVAK